MKFFVYKGYNKFKQVGSLNVSFDRITYVDISFSFPTPFGDAERFALYETKGKERPQPILKLKDETQYSFDIKKISKADFAYKESKLTHEIISDDLQKYFENTKFFIKLPFLQRIRLTYYLKKFYWQTRDFKIHIYKYIATFIIGAIIGYFLSFVF